MSRNCIPPSIIGLSKNVCNCPAFANKPIDISDSGNYISQLISIKNSATGDCGDGNIWQRMIDARGKAIEDFEIDFSVVFGKRYTTITNSFADTVGLKSYSSANIQALNFAGIRIDSQGLRGSYGILKTLKIGVYGGGNSVLKIWKGYSANNSTITNIELLYTQSITLLNNAFTDITLTTPFEFEINQNEHYFVTYELPVGMKPFNNKIPDCACQGANMDWKKTVNIRGFSVVNETVQDFNAALNSLDANGFIIDLHIKCDTSKHFCKLTKLGRDSEDYRYLAVGILHKAAINVLEDLRKSDRIDFISLTAKVSIEQRINELSVEYGAIIDYIVSKFPTSGLDCIGCITPFTQARQSILS